MNNKKVSKYNTEQAKYIILNKHPDKGKKYGEYNPRLWIGAEKEQNYSKWRIASLMTPNSLSTTTNITKSNQTKNILQMYINSNNKQLIVSPWSGKPSL